MFAHHWLTKISIAPEIRKGQAAFNGKRSVLCICSLTLLHCFLPEGALKIMPVFFITEMIGLAMGLKQKDLGIDRHFIATEEANF